MQAVDLEHGTSSAVVAERPVSAEGAGGVRDQQRLRLIAAMIEVVGENGYQGTTVARVIERAKVSRKTFYEHFANKRECLLDASDVILAEGLRRMQDAYREADSLAGRADAAIRAIFTAAIENPAALRLSVTEVTAAGPVGIERRWQSLLRFESFIQDALGPQAKQGAVFDAMLMAIVGGVSRVLYRRVRRGEHSTLLPSIPDLVVWATSYYPPTALASLQLIDSAGREVTAHPLTGGRAPGTLAPHAVLRRRRGLPRGDQNVSAAFVAHNQRERILDAVVKLTASRGYTDLKVEDVATEAAVSMHALYEHFADKEDAFLVAYEVGHCKCLGVVERAYAAESDWRLGVRAGIDALFWFLASEPMFGHIALIDVLTVSPQSAQRSDIGITAFAQMLVPRADQIAARPPAVVVEAIAGGLFALCLSYALQGRLAAVTELVPVATYFALAPFIDHREAAKIAAAATPLPADVATVG
jgi:AcrR family transcriptional regulator